MDLNAKTLRERWDAVLVSERKSFEDAVLSALHATIQTVEEQRKKLLAMESTLPESLAKTFHELIKESQAATHSLKEATLQEGISVRGLNTVIAGLTAALWQRPGSTLADSDPWQAPPSQDRASSPPTRPVRGPMPPSGPGTFPGPRPVAQRADSPPVQPSKGVPEPGGSDTITDAPTPLAKDNEQPGRYAQMMPLQFTVDGYANRKRWIYWPRRLWEKVRPSASTPPS